MWPHARDGARAHRKNATRVGSSLIILLQHLIQVSFFAKIYLR